MLIRKINVFKSKINELYKERIDELYKERIYAILLFILILKVQLLWGQFSSKRRIYCGANFLRKGAFEAPLLAHSIAP